MIIQFQIACQVKYLQYLKLHNPLLLGEYHLFPLKTINLTTLISEDTKVGRVPLNAPKIEGFSRNSPYIYIKKTNNPGIRRAESYTKEIGCLYHF